MKEIQLANGVKTLVDDEDFDSLSKCKWHQTYGGYVKRSLKRADENRRHILMHRIIMNAPEGMEVDHRDGNPLNNCRSNLRLCTHAQNSRNRKVHKNSHTGLKGAHPIKGKTQFYSRITFNGVTKYLGCFPTAEAASDAYLKAAAEIHGEFNRA